MGIEVHPDYFARDMLGTRQWHGGGVLTWDCVTALRPFQEAGGHQGVRSSLSQNLATQCQDERLDKITRLMVFSASHG